MRASSVIGLCFAQAFSVSVHAQSTNCPSPNVRDIVKDPVVAQAMDEAWNRSFANGQAIAEDGFVIYQCRNSINADYSPPVEYVTELDQAVERKRHGVRYPAARSGDRCRVVATFHTHPDDESTIRNIINDIPGLEGLVSRIVEDEPSDTDRISATGGADPSSATPFIIRYKEGPNDEDGSLVDFSVGPEVRPILNWKCPTDPEEPADPEEPTVFGPPRPASYTDPHLVTIDGLNYSFQAIGEFVLAKSEVGDLEIQSRQSRYGGPGSQVSVNTGFGFDVDGDRVSIVKTSNGDTAIFIDDVEQSQVGEVRLGSGGVISVNASSFQLIWPDGSIAVVADRGNFLNLSLALSLQHEGRISGLLGNYDGDVENDIVTSDGEDLTTRPSANDLYGIFADGWRVTDGTSLLFYYDGQDTEFFTDRLFPGLAVSISDLDDASLAIASQICGAAGISNEVMLEDCILDVGFSGDESFANAIQDLEQSASTEMTVIDVQGELGIPSQVCTAPASVDDQGVPIPDVSGQYAGSLTNPDSGTMWNTEITVEQCASDVYGLLIHTADEGFANRRFDGNWREGRLTLRAAYPYVGSQPSTVNSWCENMLLELQFESDQLSGFWSASNCPLGGEIEVRRTTSSIDFSHLDIIGDWAGPAIQFGIPDPETLTRVNFSGLLSSLEGTVEYLSTGCSSTLEYIGDDEEFLKFRETIVSGPQICVDQGVVDVRLRSDNNLDWIYGHPSEDLTIMTVLTRQ